MNSTMAFVSSITCPSPSIIVWPLNAISSPPILLIWHQAQAVCKPRQITDERNEPWRIRLRCAGAEPFLIELIIGAAFSNFQKRFVDPLPIAAIRWKENAVVFLAKDASDGLYLSLALVRRIVEQHRSIVDHGVGLPLPKRLKSIFHLCKLHHINVACLQIFHRGASLHAGDALTRKIF